MTDKKPDMDKLPPLSPDEISHCLKNLNSSQDNPEKKVPVVAIGDHAAAIVTFKASDVAEPWIRDAKAHGPALKAAIDRYHKVYSEMSRAPVAGNTCIVMRQGAMTAAIELYGTLVAEQQLRESSITSEKQPRRGDPVTKGFTVAAAYHNALAKDYMIDEARLRKTYDKFADGESLELAKIAHEHVEMHLGFAQDMLWMAIGEKPRKLDDPFGEFAKTVARLLR